MLKQRLITAALLIPLVVFSILYFSTATMQYLLAAVSLLAAWEWFAIIGFASRTKKAFALVTLLLTAVLTVLLPVMALVIVATIVWATILFVVKLYAHKPLPQSVQNLFSQPNTALLIASLVLAIFWHTAVQLHALSPLGPQQLLYVMVLVWLADTGGYFAGKRWGKCKLAIAISPNKTWEGVAGALVLGGLWAVIAFLLGWAGTLTLIPWLLLSATALLLSIVGDLFESLFKRSHNVKDSGNLLPGHGGILDRIDSLIAAAPVFFAGLYFLGAV